MSKIKENIEKMKSLSILLKDGSDLTKAQADFMEFIGLYQETMQLIETETNPTELLALVKDLESFWNKDLAVNPSVNPKYH